MTEQQKDFITELLVFLFIILIFGILLFIIFDTLILK